MYITFTLGSDNSPAYMYNYKGFWIGSITIPSPLFMHFPQCIIYTCTYTISNIIKNMRILCSHSILVLPGCIFRIVPSLLDLYQLHNSISELLGFSFQCANQSHLKSTFWLHLSHIPINDMINIRYMLKTTYFLSNDTWKTL
jgi:hypothetical protein